MLLENWRKVYQTRLLITGVMILIYPFFFFPFSFYDEVITQVFGERAIQLKFLDFFFFVRRKNTKIRLKLFLVLIKFTISFVIWFGLDSRIRERRGIIYC